ncbi:type II toxin-antitoxin system RatA family toxin [Roseateles cellulosilyticus]|uniref:Type II toxin-antitoxin system RatA family toxin n=1 Tax=Pelomonas cellulosilytica TaxID=2906762 RepID=A0ABS8XNW4_9BURK|nr:type II toxin-antitoxin system RatA family toxin [Pelomonas sp. P8]MCE4553523.1 type II toxin-antitoxin system RatA family toxin [Pelomonas sp. P8]
MKQVKKSVLLWYTPQEMYELVTAVERYPEFLPWCNKVEVLAREGDSVTARLHLAYAGVRHAFTTRNRNLAGESVRMELVDGPFSQLDGLWQFLPLSKPGSGGAVNACKIGFDLNYAFSSGALEAVVSPVFDRIANTFVDSFVNRAEVIYGAR